MSPIEQAEKLIAEYSPKAALAIEYAENEKELEKVAQELKRIRQLPIDPRPFKPDDYEIHALKTYETDAERLAYIQGYEDCFDSIDEDEICEEGRKAGYEEGYESGVEDAEENQKYLWSYRQGYDR